jgi:hypothetical protein
VYFSTINIYRFAPEVGTPLQKQFSLTAKTTQEAKTRNENKEENAEREERRSSVKKEREEKRHFDFESEQKQNRNSDDVTFSSGADSNTHTVAKLQTHGTQQVHQTQRIESSIHGTQRVTQRVDQRTQNPLLLRGCEFFPDQPERDFSWSDFPSYSNIQNKRDHDDSKV